MRILALAHIIDVPVFEQKDQSKHQGHTGSLNIRHRRHVHIIIMRPSSLGGGRILRRTLSVRLSVCPSVRPSRYRASRRATIANYNDTHVLFCTR